MPKAKRKQYDEPLGPTPERMAMSSFQKTFVHHSESQTKRECFVIKPWAVEMHNRGKLTKEQLRVIYTYLDQWEITERSPVKSNLDRSIGGDGVGPSAKFYEARRLLREWRGQGRKDGCLFIELVAGRGLGYSGAAQHLFGDGARESDVRLLRKRMLDTVGQLSGIMP